MRRKPSATQAPIQTTPASNPFQWPYHNNLLIPLQLFSLFSSHKLDVEGLLINGLEVSPRQPSDLGHTAGCTSNPVVDITELNEKNEFSFIAAPPCLGNVDGSRVKIRCIQAPVFLIWSSSRTYPPSGRHPPSLLPVGNRSEHLPVFQFVRPAKTAPAVIISRIVMQNPMMLKR